MATEPLAYPGAGIERDRFVLAKRGPRALHDPWRHQGLILEDEPSEDGGVRRSATVFLTGRECPWRCAMCDLWQQTIAEDTPAGAIPAQLHAACSELRAGTVRAAQIKLYNAGNFFDPRAVPEEDYEAVAEQLDGFERVVVESHPALLDARLDRWLATLAAAVKHPPRLEVAMGLETAHPDALERLNKRMTLEQFRRAADLLRRRSVALRVFLLIGVPFVPEEHQQEWLLRSVDTAFDAGASVVSLIPTRSGNGALESLSATGHFREPTLDEVEYAVDAAFARSGHRGRILVDLWNLDRLCACSACFGARRDRLHRINLAQQALPPVVCRAH